MEESKVCKRRHVESRVGDAALPAPMADLEEGEIEEGELPSEEPEVIMLCMLTLTYEKCHVRYICVFLPLNFTESCLHAYACHIAGSTGAAAGNAACAQ